MTSDISTPPYQPDRIFSINGLKIGQATDLQGMTGVTVLRFDNGATCAVDVRGAAPGTRETDLLRPENLVDKVHAIVLGGGSAFGLAAMTGVTDCLAEQKIGFQTEGGCIPIVTGAILYDLTIGSPDSRPDSNMGKRAALSASRKNLTEGNIGAGTGATVGKVMGTELATKSGLGTFCLTKDNLVVAAIIAVNAWGDVIKNGKVIAGSRTPDNQGFINSKEAILSGRDKPAFSGQNTTIGTIITNATLSKSQALKVAQMAHDGYSRAINPVHTLYDGDTIFAAATGEIEQSDTNLIGIMAAEVVEIAIHRAVLAAESKAGIPAITDLSSIT
ncbi:P1 family peptidase [Endozoicomonas sp. Mp262]|uniref:P1 family peptidase n=1 Tax=Endozoicomonas sp. Mp262 TaxID=2919499 RepID=UPI0021D832E8